VVENLSSQGAALSSKSCIAKGRTKKVHFGWGKEKRERRMQVVQTKRNSQGHHPHPCQEQRPTQPSWLPSSDVAAGSSLVEADSPSLASIFPIKAGRVVRHGADQHHTAGSARVTNAQERGAGRRGAARGGAGHLSHPRALGAGWAAARVPLGLAQSLLLLWAATRLLAAGHF
jgi:hypothetical protein